MCKVADAILTPGWVINDPLAQRSRGASKKADLMKRRWQALRGIH